MKHVLWLIVFGIGVFMMIKNPYTNDKKTLVTVLDKLESAGGRKSSGNFYMVFREEVGKRNFDAIVSPTTYSQCIVGQQYIFNFSEMDIRQTPGQNFLWFILPVIILSIGLVGFIGSFIKIEG